MDGLAALRARLFELIEWFGEDVDRLPAAQARWRAAQNASQDDDLWRHQVEREVERYLARLDSPPLTFEVLSPDRSAEAVLLELEAIDQVAWQWPGSAHDLAPQQFGSGDRARYVVRLGRERKPHTGKQAGVLYTHLRHHALIPLQVTVPARPGSLRVRLTTVAAGFERPVARAQIGVATTSFDDGASIEWTGERATAIHNGADRASKLWATIQAAADDGIDVLVAPELTVTPEARRWIARQLRWLPGPTSSRLALVVPGSFHEQVGQRFVHRAIAFGGSGNELLEHHKLVAYGSLAGTLEDIQLGDTVTVLITPIGTIAVAICKDFCDDHMGAIWHELQPDWLLVPAYGPGERAHQAAAARIGRMVGTVTVLAHQGDQNTPFRSFIHDAGKPSDTHGNSPDFRGLRIAITQRKS